MSILRRLFPLLIVSAAAISTPSFATPQESRSFGELPRLQVSLFNDARVDPATLAEAEARASAIFSEAGIAVEWLACAPVDPADFAPRHTACSALAWPSHLSVRIRPQAVSVSADTYGQAFVDSSGAGLYSNVYFQNLARSSRHPNLSEGELLGCVLAHELGHLLLGINSHSSSGLMQSHWDSSALHSATRSDLFFTPAQSATLRSRFVAFHVALCRRTASASQSCIS